MLNEVNMISNYKQVRFETNNIGYVTYDFPHQDAERTCIICGDSFLPLGNIVSKILNRLNEKQRVERCTEFEAETHERL